MARDIKLLNWFLESKYLLTSALYTIEELDVKTPYGCYMLSALMFVQIPNTIEEGSTNSTGKQQ